LAVIAKGFGKCVGPLLHSIHKLQSDTRSLADRFDDDRRLPARRPSCSRRVNDHETWCRNADSKTTFFGRDFIESNPGSFRPATGVRHTNFLKLLLNCAVFAISAMERQKDHIRSSGQIE